MASQQTANRATATAGRTTVALKLIMAASGALFVFYVIVHMYGNLKIFAGQEAFDTYAHHLRTLGEPILPYSGFLWVFRALLLLALVGHVYSAFVLWSRSAQARSTKYAVRQAGMVALRAKWMRWGGVTLFLFIIFHLVQFTIAKVNFNSAVSEDQIDGSPFQLVVASFQLWWVVLIYLLALAALGLHLHHGTWSAMQTLGWTTSVRARENARLAGVFIAALVVVGFALPPLAILFGIVKA